MKKYVIKATALAIGALVGGVAVAAVTTPVDLDAGTGATKFAKELAYVDATPLAPAANELNFKVAAGFGISGSSTRYIRVDYGNAKLDAAHAAVFNTDYAIGSLTAASSVVIAAGGAVGQSYVIYQVTTDAAESVSQSDLIKIKVPALRVTSNSADVTVTYSLHETGTSAQAGVTGNALLAKTSGSIAKFVPALNFTATPATVTAKVEAGFKKFDDGAGNAVKYANLGTVKLSVTGSTFDNLGAAMTLAKLYQTGAGKTNVVFTADDLAASTDDGATPPVLNGITLQTGACSGAVGVLATGSFDTTKKIVTMDVGAAVDGTVYNLCYNVTGSTVLPVETTKIALDLTPTAAAGGVGASGAEDVAAATFGAIAHDGTELVAPFATIHPDYVSRVFLTSTHSTAAKVEAQAYYDDGTSCSGTPVALKDLQPGKQQEYLISAVCPSLTTSSGSNTTRMSVRFTIAAPKSKIEGVYNQYKKADPTFANGKTTDQNTYSLHRPVN